MSDIAANIKLVEAIKQFPCLYNNTLSEYSRKDITDSAWIDVAEMVDEPISHCKEKWKNLRTVFVRRLKPVSGGVPSNHRRPYYLNEAMKFILPYVKPGMLKQDFSFSNHLSTLLHETSQETDDIRTNDHVYVKTEDFEEAEAEDENVNENVTRPRIDKSFSTKRKRGGFETIDKSLFEISQFRKNGRNYDNPRQMFLLSLVPELNEMTEPQMKSFKRKVLSLIDEVMSDDSCASSNDALNSNCTAEMLSNSYN